MKNIVNIALQSPENIKRTAFQHYGLILTDEQARDIIAYHSVRRDLFFDDLMEKFLENAIGKR
ncbi:MAG TPA: hypothetical protein VJ936_00050 [Desulfobacteraceae bacterium]|nr:hypothetical protein [Desulfobacteraceae bacterium]